MSHHVSAAETQHQYDDGEYHGCSVGSVLNILLRGAQLEEHAQWEGSCLLVQSMRNMIGESCRKHHSGTIADGSTDSCGIVFATSSIERMSIYWLNIGSDLINSPTAMMITRNLEAMVKRNITCPAILSFAIL